MGRDIFELFQELLVFFLGQLYLANLMVYLMKLLNYSHLSNNRGGWNKRERVKMLQINRPFSVNFLARIKFYSSK